MAGHLPGHLLISSHLAGRAACTAGADGGYGGRSVADVLILQSSYTILDLTTFRPSKRPGSCPAGEIHSSAQARWVCRAEKMTRSTAVAIAVVTLLLAGPAAGERL